MTVVGVSFDSPETNLDWSQDELFEFELWSDLDRVLALHYGAATSSTARAAARITVLLDHEGSLLLTYDPASPASNPAQVLSDCQQLFGGDK